jgi:guanylate kinase
MITVLAPSVEDLEKRLRNRGTETEETLAKRLKNSQSEIAEIIQLKSMIRYGIINEDITESSDAFVKLFESLYNQELL